MELQRTLQSRAERAFSDIFATTQAESEPNLNIAGVYQDLLTQNWAMQMCQRATRLVGEQSVQNAWFHADSLNDDRVLQEAVRAAVRADVIVVSVYSAFELPFEFSAWIDAWLPQRPARVGALVALVGRAEDQDAQAMRTLEYLETIASNAELDFIPQERTRPETTKFHSIKLGGDGFSALMQLQEETYFRRHDAYRHWGLND